jgi:hypothetical protein
LSVDAVRLVVWKSLIVVSKCLENIHCLRGALIVFQE